MNMSADKPLGQPGSQQEKRQGHEKRWVVSQEPNGRRVAAGSLVPLYDTVVWIESGQGRMSATARASASLPALQVSLLSFLTRRLPGYKDKRLLIGRRWEAETDRLCAGCTRIVDAKVADHDRARRVDEVDAVCSEPRQRRRERKEEMVSTAILLTFHRQSTLFGDLHCPAGRFVGPPQETASVPVPALVSSESLDRSVQRYFKQMRGNR